MNDYNIYAGLSGSFGGATYQGTLKNASVLEAEEYAYECAVSIYESYEGLYGLKTWEDCYESFCDENDIDPSFANQSEHQDDIDELYSIELENWIEYYAINKEDDEDFIESEYYEI